MQPNYDVEYVFIPENRDHPVYTSLSDEEDLVGLVETRITLSDSSQSGQATITAQHVAFTERTHAHTITFTDGVGTLYRNPDYTVTQVSFDAGGPTYTTVGSSTFTVDTRFQYATLDRILDVPVQGEVDVTFTETDGTLSSSDRVVTGKDSSGAAIDDGDVTVYQDDKGYKLAYSLSSNTNENAMVAQFALHSGQTIRVNRIPAGATYYVYEYAVGEDGSREDLKDWDTAITWDESSIEIYEIADYRAVKGTISLNDTAQDVHPVIFTNTAHVGQLTISKTVAGDQASDTDRSQSFTFTVTLKDKNGNALRGTYSYIGGTVEGINGVSAPANGILTLNSGSATFTLKHGQSITIGDLPDGATYEVTEGDHSGFTVVVDDDTDADQAAEGTIVKDQTAQARFTNIKQTTLSFIKVAAEATSQPLSGAEFMLFRLQCIDGSHDHSQVVDPSDPGSCWVQVGNTQTSGSDGAVTFGELEPNSVYRLVETKAPDGRVLPEGQWRVVTDENNRIEITAVGGQSGRLPPAFATGKSDELLLPNVRPIDIPSSGGFGALPFLLGGGLLMLTAVGIFVGKRLQGRRFQNKNT